MIVSSDRTPLDDWTALVSGAQVIGNCMPCVLSAMPTVHVLQRECCVIGRVVSRCALVSTEATTCVVFGASDPVTMRTAMAHLDSAGDDGVLFNMLHGMEAPEVYILGGMPTARGEGERQGDIACRTVYTTGGSSPLVNEACHKACRARDPRLAALRATCAGNSGAYRFLPRGRIAFGTGRTDLVGPRL